MEKISIEISSRSSSAEESKSKCGRFRLAPRFFCCLGLFFGWASFDPNVEAQDILNAPCNIQELNEFCAQLEGLGEAEGIQLASGGVYPGCALISAESASARRYRDQTQMRLAEHERLLSVIQARHPRLLTSRQVRVARQTPRTLLEIQGLEDVVAAETLARWRELVAEEASQYEARMQIIRQSRQRTFEMNPLDQQQRLDRLLGQTRQEMLNFVLRGRALNDLTPSELDVYNRFSAVTVMPVDAIGSRATSTTTVCNHGETARLSAGQQSVSIPSEHMLLPDTALQRMLAHEIAHSVDRCNFALPTRQGQPPRAFEQSPFRSAYACLGGASGGQFSSAPTTAMANGTEANTCTMGAHDEAFCDLVASHVLERQLTQDRPGAAIGSPAATQVVRPRLLFDVGPIRYRISAATENVFHLLDRACTDRHEPNRPGTHPTWTKRYLDISLRQPTLARSLGCPTTGPVCPLDFNPQMVPRPAIVVPAGSPAAQ